MSGGESPFKVLGKDVSKWQTSTPSLVGVEFLIARASIGTSKDVMYDKHIATAKKAGIITGAYHYNWNSVSISAQVNAFIAAAGNVDLYALDVEGSQGEAFSHAQTEQFIDLFQQRTGKRIGLYHSTSGYFNAGQDWRWVADWRGDPPPIRWDIWQYGLLGGVDGNRWRGTLAELRAFAGKDDMAEAQLSVTSTIPKVITIASGAVRRFLDGTPDGYVFGGAYTRYSPDEVGVYRSYYASVDGKQVRRLVKPTTVADIVAPPGPDVWTPEEQAKLDAAVAAAIAGHPYTSADLQAAIVAAELTGAAAEKDRIANQSAQAEALRIKSL